MEIALITTMVATWLLIGSVTYIMTVILEESRPRPQSLIIAIALGPIATLFAIGHFSIKKIKEK